MKFILFIIFCFSFAINNANGQKVTDSLAEIKMCLKNPGKEVFSLEEFKNFDTLRLTDTASKIQSYIAYFVCDYNFHKPSEENCNVISYVVVIGNSLKGDDFKTVLKKYTHHFYIVFDNVKIVDKYGNLKVLMNPPRVEIH